MDEKVLGCYHPLVAEDVVNLAEIMTALVSNLVVHGTAAAPSPRTFEPRLVSRPAMDGRRSLVESVPSVVGPWDCRRPPTVTDSLRSTWYVHICRGEMVRGPRTRECMVLDGRTHALIKKKYRHPRGQNASAVRTTDSYC